MSKYSRDSNYHVLQLIAKYSLESLDFVTALKAFVLAEDLAGIMFVETTSSLTDKDRQKAEVLRFLGRYDEAESAFIKINRYDLAIQISIDTSNWSRVKDSLMKGSNLDNSFKEKIWNLLGATCCERKEFEIAAEVNKTYSTQ